MMQERKGILALMNGEGAQGPGGGVGHRWAGNAAAGVLVALVVGRSRWFDCTCVLYEG